MNTPRSTFSASPPADLAASVDRTSLTEIMEQYLAELEAGERPNRAEYLARFPAVAHDLETALDGLEFLHRVSPQLSGRATDDAIGQVSRAQATVPATLGDFEIIRELGRGGMGIVYEARQISLDRRVAVKVLPFAALLDRRQLERFTNEARAAAMLKHPNIVSVYSVGVERGVHYYAMELIEGQSLAGACSTGVRGEQRKHSGTSPTAGPTAGADTRAVAALSTERLDNRGSFYRSVARLGKQAAEALQYAHEHGVIHRDIKPSNLLLDEDGSVHVTDFGLARIHSGDELTLSGDVVGTLRYMSPEQLEESAFVDNRADVYSLGLTIYELLGGQPAFHASDRQRLVKQLLTEDPAPLRKVDSRIPVDLQNVVFRAIEKEPGRRYQSAQELADDLQRFLDHRPVKARSAGWALRCQRWVQRNRLVAFLGGVLTLLTVTLAIVGPLTAWRLFGLLRSEQSLSQAKGELTESLEQQIYDSNLNLAHESYLAGDFQHAARLLERHIPGSPDQTDRRGWEWYYLRQQLDNTFNVPFHRDIISIYEVACSPDGQYLAYGTWTGAVRLLDASTLKRIDVDLSSESGYLNHAVEFSPDGTLLIEGAYHGGLRVWTIPEGKRVDQIGSDEGPVVSAAFSRDGRYLGVVYAMSWPRHAVQTDCVRDYWANYMQRPSPDAVIERGEVSRPGFPYLVFIGRSHVGGRVRRGTGTIVVASRRQ